MPATPGVTLTATLQDNSGVADAGAALRITLINPTPQELPQIAGTATLAKIKQVIVSSTGGFSVPLWGNDQITPAGTFYEIAVLDDAGNVVQAGMYSLLSSTPTIDLSNAAQILQPYPVAPSALAYLPCTGSGANYTAPGTVIMVYVGGIPQRPGIDYTVAGGTAITLAFTTTDDVYAFCIT